MKHFCFLLKLPRTEDKSDKNAIEKLSLYQPRSHQSSRLQRRSSRDLTSVDEPRYDLTRRTVFKKSHEWRTPPAAENWAIGSFGTRRCTGTRATEPASSECERGFTCRPLTRLLSVTDYLFCPQQGFQGRPLRCSGSVFKKRDCSLELRERKLKRERENFHDGTQNEGPFDLHIITNAGK